MAPRGSIAVTTALLCFILALFGPAPAASKFISSHFHRFSIRLKYSRYYNCVCVCAHGSHAGKACCKSYDRKPVSFQRIRGHKEQTISENCHIEAIVYAVRTQRVQVHPHRFHNDIINKPYR
ncbi:uncharacterized protein AB9W97_021088 [Spinachia spinachia]